MSLSTKSLIHEGAIRVARKDVDVRCTRMSRPWMPGSRLLYGGLASPLPFWIPGPYRGYVGSSRSPERRGGWRKPTFIAIAHAGWRRHTKV